MTSRSNGVSWLWWVQPLVVGGSLAAFIAYSTWAVFQTGGYYADPYISPFYTPCLAASCGEPGWTWDRRILHVAATFEPDARIDYVLVGRPDGEGRGQALDVGLVGTEPVGGVWAPDHFGVLAVLRGGPKHEDRGSCPRQEPGGCSG